METIINTTADSPMEKLVKTKNYFHLIVGTHWDREWLYPFEYTQSMLIDMMDDLIDFMEANPDYKYFHLDGQTVVVEDYLRVRPDMRERLLDLIGNGRILIGPYYSLIDESHVHGEAIIRNLFFGNKLCRMYGGRMDVGYSVSGFGRISQIPQIFKSVGLDTIIFYRGLRQDKSKMEFVWRGPDGSEILGLRLTGPLGRAWYFEKVSVPVAYPNGVPLDGLMEMHNDLSNLHRLEGKFFTPSGHNSRFCIENIDKGLSEMEEFLCADTESNQLPAMQAIDYGGPEKWAVKIVERINEVAGYEKIQFSTLPIFMRKFKDSLDGKELTVLTGEFRDNGIAARDLVVCRSVASSGGMLKVPNRKAELALSRWAEVWDTFVYALTGRSSAVLLEGAWKDLLGAHAHDSVTGQGTDEVIDNVLNRFIRVKQAADGVTDYAMGRLVRLIDMPEAAPNSVYLTVFNPSPIERSEVMKINVDMPFYKPDAEGNADLPEIWAEEEIDHNRLVDTSRVRLDIRDAAGTPVDFEVLEVRPMEPVGISHPGWGGRRLCAHRYTVWLSTGKVPPVGYKVLVASYREKSGTPDRQPLLSEEMGILENEYLRIKINGNGTLDITNKETGRIFPGSLMFEDGWEKGSSLHGRCEDTALFSDVQARIALIENTSLAATYEIHLPLRIPVGSINSGSERSSEMVDLPITSLVTLRTGSRRVDVVTKVKNSSADHRLRVLFPTGIETEVSCVDQPFDIVERPVHVDNECPNPMETPCVTYPCVSFVDVHDGAQGLAALTLGLIEYEVTDTPDRTIALTLLRCFQDVNKNCGKIDYRMKRTQNLGEHEFKYAIYLHAGDVYEGRVQQESECHMLPLKVLQSACSGEGYLSNKMSLIELEDSDLCLSAIKKGETDGSIVVRVYNPTLRDIRTTVRLWDTPRFVRIVDSLETPMAELAFDGSRFLLGVGPKSIVSFEVGIPVSPRNT